MKTLEPLPYFKWLWRDWRANRHVQRLHYIAKGLYRELLDEQWCEGFIPPDVETLADICNCPVEIMQEYWPSLQDLFETQEDGSLVNRKLEQQRTAEDTIRAAKARGGKKSAIAKINKINEVSRGVEDQLDSSSRPNPESHIAEQSRAETEQSISEQEAESFFYDDGQGDEMNLKTFKAEMASVGVQAGVKVKGYDNTWDDLKVLCIAHGYSTVVNDFEEFLSEGDEYPKGALQAYAWVAADRLTTDSPVQASAKGPEVVSLIRELAYLSGGQMAFADKHRIRLAEALKEFSAEEIIAVFKTWLETNDLSDAYTQKGAANSFSQTADQLCYSARKRKQESEQAKIARDQTAKFLQAEAEAERAARDERRAHEAELFDPLA